jgi:hypothetical protein
VKVVFDVKASSPNHFNLRIGYSGVARTAAAATETRRVPQLPEFEENNLLTARPARRT